MSYLLNGVAKYPCTLSHSCWRGTGFLASRHAQTIWNKTLTYVKKNYISCTAEQHIAYIATICAVQLFGVGAAALLYGDIGRLKNGLISFFEAGGSFFYAMLSRKAFATNSLK
jgi:hypothetical protein